MSTPRPERPSSSLSESWATLSASDIHSEDDAYSIHTDNASLVGASVPDDVASLDDHDEEHSESEDERTDTDSHCSEPHGYLRPIYHDEEESGDNNLTATASFLTNPDPVIFEEPDHWPATGTVELKHTVCTIDDIAVEDPTKDRAELTATICQTVSHEGLHLDRPFRVLYVGSSHFKGAVLDKLGDVLVANSKTITPSSSIDSGRFHVVPTAFGPDSSPNYAELLPLHVQLTVDECTAAYEDVEQPDKITLILKNGDRHSSYRAGPDYTISSTSEWALPDLAIFFLAESETSAQLARRYIAFYFMRRHGVPCMFISEKPLWGGEHPAYPVDSRLIHVGIEERHLSTQQVSVIGRCPIDLNTFESICPEQLNRNLAAVINAPKPVKAPAKRPTEVHKSHDIEKYPQNSTLHHIVNSVYEPNPLLKHVTMALIGLITMSLGYAGIKYMIILFIQYLGYSATSYSLGVPATPRTTVWSTAERMPILPPLATNDIAVSACGGGNSLAINEYIAEISRPIAGKPNESDRFQVYVIGDCHVVIKAPSTTGWRKGSRFDVKVTKGEGEYSFDFSRLFDGVYALRLDREVAYGVMNVTITTKTKPIVDQVTVVDFGTPWLKIDNWKRAAHSLSSLFSNELNDAQAGLSKAYDRVSLDLQPITKAVHREYDLVRDESIQRARETANLLAVKSKKWREDMHRDVRTGIASSSALLRDRAGSVQTGVSEYIHDAWTSVYQQAKRVNVSAPKVTIADLGHRVREMRKSRALATAQQHVRGLTHWCRTQDSPLYEKEHTARLGSL